MKNARLTIKSKFLRQNCVLRALEEQVFAMETQDHHFYFRILMFWLGLLATFMESLARIKDRLDLREFRVLWNGLRGKLSNNWEKVFGQPILMQSTTNFKVLTDSQLPSEPSPSQEHPKKKEKKKKHILSTIFLFLLHVVYCFPFKKFFSFFSVQFLFSFHYVQLFVIVASHYSLIRRKRIFFQKLYSLTI